MGCRISPAPAQTFHRIGQRGNHCLIACAYPCHGGGRQYRQDKYISAGTNPAGRHKVISDLCKYDKVNNNKYRKRRLKSCLIRYAYPLVTWVTKINSWWA